MLADAGARYVILGHSERRQGRRETGHDIARKTERVLSSGMRAIVCIGETESQMLEGVTEPALQEQLFSSLPEGVDWHQIVIAYEPIWAIGTGRTPSLDRVAQLHDFVRQSLTDKLGNAANAVQILYGGSVKADNARDISTIPNVDGALVGGASLKAQDFLAIVRSYDAGANSASA
jgi:triosephosphate isomerase